MPDPQPLINLARADAQGLGGDSWEPQKASAKDVAADQARSDALSSPNHRLSVLKAGPSGPMHPAAVAARAR